MAGRVLVVVSPASEPQAVMKEDRQGRRLEVHGDLIVAYKDGVHWPASRPEPTDCPWISFNRSLQRPLVRAAGGTSRARDPVKSHRLPSGSQRHSLT